MVIIISLSSSPCGWIGLGGELELVGAGPDAAVAALLEASAWSRAAVSGWLRRGTSDPWVFALRAGKIAIIAKSRAIFRCLPGLPWRRLPIYIG